jgi:hypothetical protein
MFRKPLLNLIDRTKSVKYKNAAVEFDIQAEIKEQTKRKGNIFSVTKDTLTYDDYLDAIMLLSNWYANAALCISPDSGFKWQRETAIYALEQTERKLKEAGRKDSDKSKIIETTHILIRSLKQGVYLNVNLK